MVFDSYDSMSLIMLFKKGNPYYGDTTLQQSFQVQRVDTLYQLADYARGFFSNSSFPLNGTILGTASATIAPNIPFVTRGYLDTLKIRLSDSLGLALYNMMKANSDSITKSAVWLNWFHGLCVSPQTGSQGCIYGFRDSAIMRMYYHAYALNTTESFIDFGITNKTYQFNNITKNWAGSPCST